MQTLLEERQMCQKHIDDVVKSKVAKPRRRLVKRRDSELKEDTWMYQQHNEDVVNPSVAKPRLRLVKIRDLKPMEDAHQQRISREKQGNGKQNVEASWNKKDLQRNPVFIKHFESEWIENPTSKKRKLEQLVKDKVRAFSHAIPDQQDTNKEGRRKLSHPIPVPCLVNFCESTKPPAEKTIICSKRIISSSTFSGPLLENCQGNDTVINSDIFVSDSSPTTPHNFICATSCEQNEKNLNPARRSKRQSNFISDRLRKSAIPIGPMFQAVIPDFCGIFDKDTLIDQYKNNSDNLKWLGTRIWPPEIENTGNVDKEVGKGRTDICKCMTPSSVECIKRHSYEAWIFLRVELGPAFFCWKFNEMGEHVAKAWTLKEQQTFDSLMKIRPSYSKNFLMLAVKSIPKKSIKEIVNYYFNVYIPRRISVETRSSSEKIGDSDFEDETKGYGVKFVTTSESKKVKYQYLRRD